MRKKICCLSFMLLICIVMITGCGQNGVGTGKDNQKGNMPEIVFDYTFLYDSGTHHAYKFVFVDKYGDVYYGNSENYFDITSEERMSLYETFKNDSNCKKINVADMEQLQQQYDLLQHIRTDGDNEITIEESGVDACLGQYEWTGYCYDENGKVNSITLYGEGDCTYVNNDTRAKEIADWIDSLNTEGTLRWEHDSSECCDITEFPEL